MVSAAKRPRAREPGLTEPSFPEGVGERERARWVNTLANLTLLEQADSKTVSTLVQGARFSLFPPRKMVYREGDPAVGCHVLIEGVVRVFQRNGSVEYTPKIFGAPIHFGDLAGLAGFPAYRSSVETLTPSVVGTIDLATVEACLESDHALCLAWLKSLARQHAITIDSDRQSVFGGIAARMANVLLSYAEVFGAHQRSGTVIEHALSYNALARQIGCSRQTAIRLIQAMTGARVIERTRDGLLVQLDELRRGLLPGRLSLAHRLSSSSEER
jgi:CRP-like cAMP-binding protein